MEGSGRQTFKNREGGRCYGKLTQHRLSSYIQEWNSREAGFAKREAGLVGEQHKTRREKKQKSKTQKTTTQERETGQDRTEQANAERRAQDRYRSPPLKQHHHSIIRLLPTMRIFMATNVYRNIIPQELHVPRILLKRCSG